MPELQETSLVFSLHDLLERERQRVAQQEAEQRRLAMERRALAEQRERERRERAEAGRAEQERRTAERERLERERAARLEAFKQTEIERARIAARAASEAETLRVRLLRAERRLRLGRALACAAALVLACVIGHHELVAEPRAEADREALARRLAHAEGRAGELAAALADTAAKAELLAGELSRRRQVDARAAPTQSPEAGPAPARPAPPPRVPKRPVRREKAPCLDDADPLNPCLP